jgi:hypothetical protein
MNIQPVSNAAEAALGLRDQALAALDAGAWARGIPRWPAT